MIKCTKFTSQSGGCLQGFADIYIDGWGIEIIGFTLFMKNGKRWIGMPTKQYEQDGEIKYRPLIRFKDRNRNEKFLSLCKEAIDEYCRQHREEQLK